jgi:hypothetical protein
LLLDSGEQAHVENKSIFSFELSWLRKDGFMEMVSKEWNSVKSKDNPMETWQSKIRHVRSFLRGWAKHTSSVYKKEKERLPSVIDFFGIKRQN